VPDRALSCAGNRQQTGRQLEEQAQKPRYVAEPPAADPVSTGDARSATLNRIRKTLVTSRLTLAGEAAGGDPYDSRRGREPGAVWRDRRR
jgi:hypothetical protein